MAMSTCAVAWARPYPSARPSLAPSICAATCPTQAARHGHHARHPHLPTGGQALLVRGLQRAPVGQRGLCGGREAGRGQGTRGRGQGAERQEGQRAKGQGAVRCTLCSTQQCWVAQPAPPSGSAVHGGRDESGGRNRESERGGSRSTAKRGECRKTNLAYTQLLANKGPGDGGPGGHGCWRSGS